ncbi:MAG: AMP-binding protein [Neisseria sp.]|uniref:AMP-binding protein n=1 Tax=Neisseria sp. TaxID=192066 RepID=UPI0026DB9642|nr:AMP-binding protein [Neisseria sp.]MDO4640207.1 AMP-binding protein [Neisseria sp.]
MEKIWLKNYEPGIDAEIDVQRYQSILDVFEQSVEKFRDQIAFTSFGSGISYGEMSERVKQFASYLQNVLKLPRGERIAVMMPNVLQYPVAIFGALKAGMVVVNVNPLYTPRELAHQLNDSGANTIVVLENFAHTLAEVLPHTDIKHVMLTSIGDMLGTVKGAVANFIARKIKKIVPPFHIANTVSFKQALQQGSRHTLQPVELNREDLALLQYTGGTTGVAKGAMLTHGNICANMMQAAEWIKPKLQAGKETVVTVLPLYHIFSFTVNLMIFTQAGSKNILIANPRDLTGMIKTLKKERVSVFIGVNTLYNGLLNKPELKEVDFSTWHLCLGGGMATQKAVAERWKALTGQAIVDAYGLTETSPGVCCNPLNIQEYTGTIGFPLPSTEIELRNADGSEVAQGEAGELWVRGPQVMKGYWNRPEETAKVLDARGFLETGDIAVMDNEGRFKLVDRKKDLIVVSGFNVYPNEVEDVVVGHPKASEAACIGVNSEKTGEALKLFVVRKDDSLTKEDLIAYCRTQLTAYKVPRDIEFREELPKSNVGKILRRVLRDEVEAKEKQHGDKV